MSDTNGITETDPTAVAFITLTDSSGTDDDQRGATVAANDDRVAPPRPVKIS